MLSYGYSIGDLSPSSLVISHELSKIILSPLKPRFVIIGTLSEIMEWMRLNGNLTCEYDDDSSDKDDNKDYYDNIIKDNNKNNVARGHNKDLKKKKSATFTHTNTHRIILFELYTSSQQQQQHEERHQHHTSFKSLFSLNKVDRSSNSSSSTSTTTIFHMVIKPEQIYRLHNGKYYTVRKEGDKDEVEEGYTMIKRNRCQNGITLSHVLSKWTTNSDNDKNHHHTKKSSNFKLGSDFDY